MAGHHLVIEGFGAFCHNAVDLPGSVIGRQMVERHGLLDRPKQAPGIVSLEQKSNSGVLFGGQITDDIPQTSHRMGNRLCDSAGW